MQQKLRLSVSPPRRPKKLLKKRLLESLQRKPELRESKKKQGNLQSRKDWLRKLRLRGLLNSLELRLRESKLSVSLLSKKGQDLRLRLVKLSVCDLRRKKRLVRKEKLLRLLSELVNRHLPSRGLEKRRKLDSRLLPRRLQELRQSRRG